MGDASPSRSELTVSLDAGDASRMVGPTRRAQDETVVACGRDGGAGDGARRGRWDGACGAGERTVDGRPATGWDVAGHGEPGRCAAGSADEIHDAEHVLSGWGAHRRGEARGSD